MSQPASVVSFFPRLLVFLLDCVGLKQRASSSATESQGVERELKISHRQPHLVPPMKLVLYEEMPKSPLPRPGSARRVSQWVSQGRDLASRASDRASLIVKKKLSKQSIISAPMIEAEADESPTRRQRFRPLELSIYLPGNRLSDLPEFGEVDFTEAGEIQIPPKAFIRPQSEAPGHSSPNPLTRPAVSMVGERQLDYWQQRRPSSSHRPPSACEGLSSHPTGWDSLPGLPRQASAIRTLSPTVEEVESCSVSRAVDGMTLHFPPVEEEEEEDEEEDGAHQVLADSSTPVTATALSSSILLPYKKPVRPDPARLNSFHQSRISQWLSRSSSSSRTVSLDSKSGQFYQCAISPRPHQQQHPSPSSCSQIRRGRSFSNASTVASSMGSPAGSLASMTSMTSMTTSPTLYSSRSRSGTLRSLGKPVTVVLDEADKHDGRGGRTGRLPDVPDIPDIYTQTHHSFPTPQKGEEHETTLSRPGMAF